MHNLELCVHYISQHNKTLDIICGVEAIITVSSN